VRLEAEMIRDNALAVSGLLHRKVGGPSVFPYQPEGVWANPYSSDKWNLSGGGDQFRRGLYTFWRRTAPYASFMAFDAPSREVSCVRRPRTNTPLQALVTLNDPAFVSAAIAFGRRIVDEGGATTETRLDFAFKTALARRPTEVELTRLSELMRRAQVKYQQDETSARRWTGVADDSALSREFVAEWAAWGVVANVLLNLDELLTKG
jgi:Protein of unknown function (DUF1553)